MADMIRCLLVIYSQNHVANPGINGNMIGDGFPPQWEPFPSSIVKLTLVQFSTDDTRGVIHPIKETLYGCVYWLLTDWWTFRYMVHKTIYHHGICGEPKNRFDGKLEYWTIPFWKWKVRFGSLPTNFVWYTGVSENGWDMWDNSIPFHNSEN